MASVAGSVTEEEVVHKYRILQNEVQMLSSKSTELDLERQEHDLVLEALGNCDESRRCFRLVGGVLVERTVGEVRPAVTKNRDNITDSVAQLNKRLEMKTGELKELQEKYKIREKLRGSGDDESAGGDQPPPPQQQQQAASTGVLV